MMENPRPKEKNKDINLFRLKRNKMTIKDIRNLFRLKKEIEVIKDTQRYLEVLRTFLSLKKKNKIIINQYK